MVTAIGLLSLLLALPLTRGISESDEWLNGPVGIIVSDEERGVFHGLQSEEERRGFIAQFWVLRDPRPESPANEFRLEFDRRVARANMLFGGDVGIEGWQTERGRYYVLLGPPASRGQYAGYSQLRPIELWFYSGQKEHPDLKSMRCVIVDETVQFQPARLLQAVSSSSVRIEYQTIARISKPMAEPQ